MGCTIGVVKRYGPTEVKARITKVGISFTHVVPNPEVKGEGSNGKRNTSERDGENTLPRRNWPRAKVSGRKKQVQSTGKARRRKAKPTSRKVGPLPLILQGEGDPRSPESLGAGHGTTSSLGGAPQTKHTTPLGGDAA